MRTTTRGRPVAPVLAVFLLVVGFLVSTGPSSEDAAAETGRDPLLWPFSPESIWNMPIGSGAAFADPGFYQPPNGYGTDSNPIVMAPTSPARPVYTHAWPARCYQNGDTATGISLPVPDNYVVAPGDGNWEGNMPNLAGGVLLADGRTIQEFNYFARCTPGGPVSLTPDGLRSKLDLYGNGRPDSFFGGHGGSGLSGVGGSIRRGELTSPTPIRHVTKLTVDMTRWGRQSGGRNSYRWPAYAADSDSTGQTYGINARGYTPILDMGALLAIPGSFDLTSLALETGPAKKLAQAWQDYGAYIVDNSGFDGGWGQNLLNIEHGVRSELASIGIDMSTYADWGWQDTAWNRDMNRLFRALRLVANNGPGSIGGGGTPRVPLAPAFGASSPTTTSPAAPPTTAAPGSSSAAVDLIRVSERSDRTGSRALNGTTVDSEAFVFVDDPSVVAVAFTLDGVPARSEAWPPFDFEQSSDELATPLRSLPLGAHRIGALLTLGNGAVVSVEAAFTRGDAPPATTTTSITLPPPTTTTLPPTTTTLPTTTTTTLPTTTTTIAPPAGPLSLIRVSETADRRNSRPLDGTTIDDQVYVFVDDPNVSRVAFSLDGRATRRENAAPFDFEPSDDAAATPLRQLSLGVHRIGARLTMRNGTVVTVEATFARGPWPWSTTTTVPAPAPVDPLTALVRVSETGDRVGSRALHETILDDETYVFVDDPQVVSVSFLLDGATARSEAWAPFDFEQSSDEWATPLRPLAPGRHAIGATLTLVDGTVRTVVASFTKG